jgi:tetratricopeptide (TPR) repeat protein
VVRDLGETKVSTISYPRVAWNPDGRSLAWTDPRYPPRAQVADFDSGRVVLELNSAESLNKPLGGNIATQVTWSPDGARLLTSDTRGLNVVWARATGSPILTFQGDQGSYVAWTPDGTRLAHSGRRGAIEVLDPATGRPLTAMTGHGEEVFSLAFDRGGRRLASAGRDGLVRIWDASGGRERLTLTGHSGAVMRVSWHPDGRRLASSGEDGTVRVWDAATGREILTLPGHGQRDRALAWSPDGRRLASGGGDGTVRVRDASAAWGASGPVPEVVAASDRWRKARGCLALSRAELRAGRTREAEDALRDAIGRVDGPPADYPTWYAPRKQLAVEVMDLARVALDGGALEPAGRFARQAREVWRGLARELPRRGDFRMGEVRACEAWGRLMADKGRPGEAEGPLREAADLLDRAAAAFPTSEVPQLRLDVLSLLADTLVGNGRSREAYAAFRRAMAVAEGSSVVVARGSTVVVATGSGEKLYNSYAWFLATCREAELRRPELAVSLAREATKHSFQNKEWRTLGVACYRVDDWPAAIEALRCSMALGDGGDAYDWYFLAMAYWKTGDQETARTWYDRAVAWSDRNRPESEELQRFHAEASTLIASPPQTPGRRSVAPPAEPAGKPPVGPSAR